MVRTALMAVLFVGLSTAFISDTSFAQGRRCGSAGTFANLESVGLTADNRLVCFRETTGGVGNIGTINGLAAGDALVGIDFRPANGLLYGLGTLGNVYTFASAGAGQVQATLVASLVDANGAPIALTGTSFGVDFNPVPDRLRIIGDDGQNLRVNVDNGMTLVDGTLNLTPGVATLGVTAAGYSNNDADAGTLTVLNVINTAADQVTLQAPPNAGVLNPLGTLGVDASTDTTLDVFSLIQNGTTVDLRALAAFVPAGATSVSLYDVNLASGRATLRRTFAANTQVIGIAIPLVQGPN